MQRNAYRSMTPQAHNDRVNHTSGRGKAGVYSIIALILCVVFSPTTVRAQGSIFGTVKNGDLSSPEVGELKFFGFVNGSDYELHTQSIVGAGYDNGNWYDDFQNYLNNTAGMNYKYFFWNPSTSEGYTLAGQIPNNSFEQENIQLTTVTWPQPPQNLTASRLNDTEVTLTWEAQPGQTFHVYRRINGVNGSYFRIDNELGELSDPGVSTETFHDADAGGQSEYQYVVLAEDSEGSYSQPSAPVVPTLASQCCTLPGDADGNGRVNIGDVTFLLQAIFASGPAPTCVQQADVDHSNRINIGDVTFLFAMMFSKGPLPECAVSL